jgi:hypothetical protein
VLAEDLWVPAPLVAPVFYHIFPCVNQSIYSPTQYVILSTWNFHTHLLGFKDLVYKYNYKCRNLIKKGIYYPCVYADEINKANKFKSDTSKPVKFLKKNVFVNAMTQQRLFTHRGRFTLRRKYNFQLVQLVGPTSN